MTSRLTTDPARNKRNFCIFRRNKRRTNEPIYIVSSFVPHLGGGQLHHRCTGPKISDPLSAKSRTPYRSKSRTPIQIFQKYPYFPAKIGEDLFLLLAYFERKNRPFLVNVVKKLSNFSIFDPNLAKFRTPYRQNLGPPIGSSGQGVFTPPPLVHI